MVFDWTQTRGSEGLSVVALAVASLPAGPLALAATTSGLFISKDEGQNWQRAPSAFGTIPLLAVCLSPSYESDRLAFVGTKGGIWYTHNFTEWALSRLPCQEVAVISLVAAPNFSEEGVLLAGTLGDGVLRSGDRGVSWQAWNFGLLDLGVLGIAISPAFALDQTALVATATGIFRTTNGGRAWREAVVPKDGGPVLALAFSPNYRDDDLILATTEEGVVLRSLDAGHTWVSLEMPCAGRALNALVFSSHFVPDAFIILGAGNSVYLSSDGGCNWETLHAAHTVLSLVAGTGANGCPFVLAGLEEGGIWRGVWDPVRT
jgi:photosystem II stability/assembly factor-like uncharacterized protein